MFFFLWKHNRHANKANEPLSIPANIVDSAPPGLASVILIIISLVFICYAAADNYIQTEKSLPAEKFYTIYIILNLNVMLFNL